MSWANAYVGTPYADLGRSKLGCDCWGLARLVYEQELGITLPSYLGDYVSAEERAEIDGLIGDAEHTGPWRPSPQIMPFDLLVFRRGRLRSHIGIALSARHMLHMDGEDQARIVRLAEPRWQTRYCGAYRHVKRGVNAQ